MSGGEELALQTWPADRVPGLWNAQLVRRNGVTEVFGVAVIEEFNDLTTAQVSYVAAQRGARIETAA